MQSNNQSCWDSACVACSSYYYCTQCISAYTAYNGECKACGTGCIQCTYVEWMSNTECEVCANGYYMGGSFTSCSPCVDHCDSCSGPYQCSSCGHGYKWDGADCTEPDMPFWQIMLISVGSIFLFYLLIWCMVKLLSSGNKLYLRSTNEETSAYVKATGVYQYRQCVHIKVKRSQSWSEKSAFDKLWYLKSVAMTFYSLFLTVYLTVMVVICTNHTNPEYDVFHLMPNYSFSGYEDIFWRLRYLNFVGLVQVIMSWHIDADKYNADSSGFESFHPRARYQRATEYGNMKDNIMNQIKFFTKKLTLINLTVNIILLSTAYAHYSLYGFVLLAIQTVNDYFFVSDFNTFESKYKPDGICQKLKVKMIELVTNWAMILILVLTEICVVIVMLFMFVISLFCCATGYCCFALVQVLLYFSSLTLNLT